MVCKKISVCLVLVLIFSLTACNVTTTNEEKFSDKDIKKVINYSAPVDENKDTMPLKDLKKVEEILGQGVTRDVNEENKYRLYNYDDGNLYVFYTDSKIVDYDSIIFAVASEKNPGKIDFSNIKTGSSTIDDVEKIDPATKKSLVTSGKDYYTIHLTDSGIIFIHYDRKNDNYYVSQVSNQYQFNNYTEAIKSEDLIN